jgi:hypothetical protein
MPRGPQTKFAFKLVLWAERPCNPTIGFKLGPTTISILNSYRRLSTSLPWSVELAHVRKCSALSKWNRRMMIAPGLRKTKHHAGRNVGQNGRSSLSQQRHNGRKKKRGSQQRGTLEVGGRTSGQRTRTTHWSVRLGKSVRTVGGRLRSLSEINSARRNAIVHGVCTSQFDVRLFGGPRREYWPTD